MNNGLWYYVYVYADGDTEVTAVPLVYCRWHASVHVDDLGFSSVEYVMEHLETFGQPEKLAEWEKAIRSLGPNQTIELK